MDVQCEWLCWGGGFPSPHCYALPFGPGTLILHLNICPYLSSTPPSQEQLPTPAPTPLHPEQLPKCLSPMSLPQRAGPMALFPAGNPQSMCALSPRAYPRQCFPKPASSEDPLALVTLPTPQSSSPLLFPKLDQSGPGAETAMARWFPRLCWQFVPVQQELCWQGASPTKCFDGRQDTGSSLRAKAGLPQGCGDPCSIRDRRYFAGDWIFIVAGGPWGRAGQKPLPRALLRAEAHALYIFLLL